MSALTVLPISCWAAWLLAAWGEGNEALRAIYLAYALLYAAPLAQFTDGFGHFGPAAAGFWLACALHVQVCVGCGHRGSKQSCNEGTAVCGGKGSCRAALERGLKAPSSSGQTQTAAWAASDQIDHPLAGASHSQDEQGALMR
jgi:hypothetical protein